jgi:hypothetical protein
MSLPAERIGLPAAGAGRSLSPALTFSYKLLVRRAKNVTEFRMNGLTMLVLSLNMISAHEVL